MSHHNDTPTIVSRIINILNEDERRNALVGVHLLRTREREKIELQELNKLLNEFVTEMSRLDTQNQYYEDLTRECVEQLESIKKSFQQGIKVGRERIDSAAKAKYTLETEISRYKSDLEDYKARINLSDYNETIDNGRYDELEIQLCNTENQLRLLTEKVRSLTQEINDLKNENERLINALKRVKDELDNERLKKLELKDRFKWLDEKNKFLSRQLEQDFGDHQEGETGRRSNRNPVDCRKIAVSIRGISGEFNNWARETRDELNSLRIVKVNKVYPSLKDVFNNEKERVLAEIERYRVKVEKSKIEHERLRTNFFDFKKKVDDERERYIHELTQLENKLQTLVKENIPLQQTLKVLISDNHSLKAEIEIYRKMVGGETYHLPVYPPTEHSPRLPGPEIVDPTPLNPQERIDRGELIVRTVRERRTYNGGDIQFGEIPYDGKYVLLENIGNKDVKIGSWKIFQKVGDNSDDTREEMLFEFPTPTILKARDNTGKIWNRNHKIFVNGALEVSELNYHGTWNGQKPVYISLKDNNNKEWASYEHKITTRERGMVEIP